MRNRKNCLAVLLMTAVVITGCGNQQAEKENPSVVAQKTSSVQNDSLFCLLMTLTNILNTKYTMSMQDTGAQPQMAAMKWMMYLMPIMFLFVLNDYPSGLNYYYFVSTLISVGTMILLRRTTDETKLLAILEAKKKDPKQMKKTGFAARLEAMQKQQEQLQQQRQNKK